MTNKIDFDEMGKTIFSYVLNLYCPDDEFPYPLQRGLKGSVLGSVFASYIAFMLGRVNDLPGKDRLCQSLLALRDPKTGLFSDPGILGEDFMKPQEHSSLYVALQITSFAHACLHCLGVKFDSRVHWIAPLLEPNALEEWLDKLNWSNPWLVSNMDMFLGNFLIEWQRADPGNQKILTALDRYFKWHDKNQVPETGYWGDQEDFLSAMAGAYHIILHYDFCGKKLQYIDEMIDSTLSLAWKDGLYVYGGGGGSCEDMDAIDLLIRLSKVSDHGQKEVKSILNCGAVMIHLGQGEDGGFAWRLTPGPGKIPAILGLGDNRINALKGLAFQFIYKMRYRSHYNSIHYYSSLRVYPFKINESDMWSTWFRALSMALVARRYPDLFSTACHWRFFSWPGLGYDPF